MAKPLTVKQDAFVKAYLLNGGNAAIDAGYREKTAQQIGSENLLKPVIAASIKEHQKKNDSNFIYTKDEKLKLLQKVMSRCSIDDEEKGMVNSQSVIAAIKEHNLMQGDNAPIEQVNTNDNIEKVVIEVVGGS